jgi:hypothetical protein
MGQNTNIEWCDHTFNPWRGCTKVSNGCKNCYAETLSLRNPAVLGEWGPSGRRVIAAPDYWKQPLKWDRDAKAKGRKALVSGPSARRARGLCEGSFKRDEGSWFSILIEEVCEAIESAVDWEPDAREELIQVAAVAVAMVEMIDRKHSQAMERDHK